MNAFLELPTTSTVDVGPIPDHSGENYIEILRLLHHNLKPKTYLEIGTSMGSSLSLATCRSLAIDPCFALKVDVIGKKTSCYFEQTTSDEFFANSDPTQLLRGKVDLAFLDGMHWYEYCFRDFINVEKHCNPNSIIAIHDCIPTDLYIARRNSHDYTLRETSSHPDWWAGDVWKAVAILKKVRSDLQIFGYNAPPTGLILITRLDPHSRVLQDRYFELVEAMKSVDPAGGSLAEFISSLDVRSTSSIADWSGLSRSYWL